MCSRKVHAYICKNNYLHPFTGEKKKMYKQKMFSQREVLKKKNIYISVI